MKTTPSISTIIPTYNRAKYLGAAIDSVLGQTLPVDEIIIVDDGSTDNTAEIVQRIADSPSSVIPLKYIPQPNRGPASARNTGIGLASGELIAFLDSDDIWVKGKTELQVNILKQHPEDKVVLGRSKIFFDKGEGEILMTDSVILTGFPGGLFRRGVFDTVGLLDETVVAEDMDWYLRAWEAGVNIHAHAEVVTFYRRHSENLTAEKGRLVKNTLYALRDSIKRREQSGMTPNKPFLAENFLEKIIRDKRNG